MYGSSIPWQKTIPRCSVYQWGFCDGLDTGVYFSVRRSSKNHTVRSIYAHHCRRSVGYASERHQETNPQLHGR